MLRFRLAETFTSRKTRQGGSKQPPYTHAYSLLTYLWTMFHILHYYRMSFYSTKDPLGTNVNVTALLNYVNERQPNSNYQCNADEILQQIQYTCQMCCLCICGWVCMTSNVFVYVCFTYQSLWQTVCGWSAWVEGDSRLQQQLLTQWGDVCLSVCLQTKLEGV